jgi:hypothetical protein
MKGGICVLSQKKKKKNSYRDISLSLDPNRVGKIFAEFGDCLE